MPTTGERNDPYRGYVFEVEIDNTSVAGFRECSGLAFDTEPVEYREGTDTPLHVRKLSGLRKFGNIMLKRGFTDNTELWDWYKDVLNGTVQRRNGAIILKDEERTPKLRWEFSEGWICKWEGPQFNATASDVVIESIEICVERVELV
jgi:phage tail-like protein